MVVCVHFCMVQNIFICFFWPSSFAKEAIGKKVTFDRMPCVSAHCVHPPLHSSMYYTRLWPKPVFAPQKELLLVFSNFVHLVNLAFFMNFWCKSTFCRRNLTSLCHSLYYTFVRRLAITAKCTASHVTAIDTSRHVRGHFPFPLWATVTAGLTGRTSNSESISDLLMLGHCRTEREDLRQHCTVSVIVCNQCYVQMTTSHGTGNDGWRLAGSSVAEMIWRLIIQAQITFILPVSRYRQKYWHKNNTLQYISTWYW